MTGRLLIDYQYISVMAFLYTMQQIRPNSLIRNTQYAKYYLYTGWSNIGNWHFSKTHCLRRLNFSLKIIPLLPMSRFMEKWKIRKKYSLHHEGFVVIIACHTCLLSSILAIRFCYILTKNKKKRCIYLTPPNPKNNWKFKIINRQAMSLNSDKIVMVSYFCPKHARCIMLGYLKFLVCDITLIWNDNLWNNVFFTL